MKVICNKRNYNLHASEECFDCYHATIHEDGREDCKDIFCASKECSVKCIPVEEKERRNNVKVICNKSSEECEGYDCDHRIIHVRRNDCEEERCGDKEISVECIPIEEKERKVIDYRIVTGQDAASLEDGVRRLLSDGWEFLGGVSVSMDAVETILFSQAMVKYNDVTKEEENV